MDKTLEFVSNFKFNKHLCISAIETKFLASEFGKPYASSYRAKINLLPI